MMALATLLCAVLGLSLGGLGGGGSVLAFPLLVYVAGMSPSSAAGVSLFIVGMTSAVAALTHARRGNIDLRTAALFGGAGIPGAFFGAHFSSLVEPRVLLGSFAIMLILVAAWMGLGRVPAPRPARPWPVIAAIGACVGVLAGFFGVGGGFMIVPALTGLAGVDTRRAIGTSLIVIALNSVGGMIEHFNHLAIPVDTAFVFTAAATAGALVGQRVSQCVSVAQLRRAFAVLIMVVAVLVSWRVLIAP
jgi:uncharacterized membrane protein YfcA